MRLEYSGTMGDPVEAAKRHKLTHVLERCGGTGAESFLVSERLNSTDAQYAPR